MCDLLARSGWTAMVTRIGTITETVARLSEVLQTSCELISFLAVRWWDAGSGGCRHSWPWTLCRNGVLLTLEPGGLASARVTLLRKRESYPLVSSDAAESAAESVAENGQGDRFGFKFFDWLMSG